MRKILGLDLGSTSVGWAFIHENEEQSKIIGHNVEDGGTLSEQESLETFSKWVENQQIYIKEHLNESMLFCHTYNHCFRLASFLQYFFFYQRKCVIHFSNKCTLFTS